jgi:hypothetical protein
MKVLGLNFGRVKGECRKYLDIALKAAQDDGAQIELINTMPLKINRCIGCGSCSRNSRDKGQQIVCIIKDDYAKVREAILDADAIIVAAPVYVLAPTGQLKNLTDRLGPANDRAAVTREYYKRVDPIPDPADPRFLKQRDQTGIVEPLDIRVMKKWHVAYISVGGARDHHWVSLGIPQMKFFGFPLNMNLVDEVDIHGAHGPTPRTRMFMDRTEKLGHNVAAALGKHPREVMYCGDDSGVCPTCHGRMITVTRGTNVECPVCGITGKLTIENGAIKVRFPLAEQDRSRFAFGGLLEHTNFGNMVSSPPPVPAAPPKQQ